MARIECRATSLGSHGTPPFMNIYNVSCDDGDEDTVGDALPSIFQTFYDAWASYMQIGTSWVLFDRMLAYLTSNEVKILTPAQKSSGPSGSADALPTQLSAVLSWSTGLAGPSNRGRTYLGPFNVSANADGGTNSTMRADMVDAGNALITAIEGISGVTAQPHLVVWTAHSGGIPIISCSSQVRFRTQRRRN